MFGFWRLHKIADWAGRFRHEGHEGHEAGRFALCFFASLRFTQALRLQMARFLLERGWHTSGVHR
jgi:hypothetical protein